MGKFHVVYFGSNVVPVTLIKPILDEITLVGTELDLRQRDAAGRNGGETAEERTAIESLQKRLLDLQTQASQYVVGNEMALLYQRHGGVGLNASTGKDLTRSRLIAASFLAKTLYLDWRLGARTFSELLVDGDVASARQNSSRSS